MGLSEGVISGVAGIWIREKSGHGFGNFRSGRRKRQALPESRLSFSPDERSSYMETGIWQSIAVTESGIGEFAMTAEKTHNQKQKQRSSGRNTK